ncbi:hypothetical protein BYT27DRAFT_7209327 [Phlegmacium glaucopus]|nr:hypothetical protein BYT27DRAFT_7209327 [Phlegmacium glaucopus]
MSLGSVARGDSSQKITVLIRGVVTVQLKDLINTMIRTICKEEATRVSQEVGTEGKLGGQALILNVEVQVTKAFALGDLSKKIEVDACGEILDLKNSVNTILRALAAEVTRVTLELGSQGKLGDQAHVLDVEAEPNSMVDQLSAFSSEVTSVALGVGMQGILRGQARVEENLTDQVRSISEEVTTAIALGDLAELANVDVRGDLKMTVNSMVAQLSTLANEVTRVLTDNVNLMAMNLTNKVRSIAEVTKAVAGGALTKVIEVDVRGEILELKETVNGMTGSLSVFADEVTRVAREWGRKVGWVVRPESRMLVEGFDG